MIETKGAEVKQNVAVLRLMQADVESLYRKLPEYQAELKKVAEALRYSDPMIHSSLTYYDEQIQRIIFAMSSTTGNESAKIPQQCEELLNLIADRNSRAKMMK